MTKKDYELIASVIRELKSDGYGVTDFDGNAIENAFVEYLKKDNPLFNCNKFSEFINK